MLIIGSMELVYSIISMLRPLEQSGQEMTWVVRMRLPVIQSQPRVASTPSQPTMRSSMKAAPPAISTTL